MIIGLMIEAESEEPLFHLIDWGSCKQRRVSHSSYEAEILACADANDGIFYLKESIHPISPTEKIKNILHLDSKGLYDTIKPLHLEREYAPEPDGSTHSRFIRR